MFRPNTTCTLYTRSPEPDRRGEFSYGPPQPNTPCGVTGSKLLVERTSVRADSSGSRGKGLEEQGSVRLLFPTSVSIGEGDIVFIDGEYLLAQGIFYRRGVLGPVDHIQVDFQEGHKP